MEMENLLFRWGKNFEILQLKNPVETAEILVLFSVVMRIKWLSVSFIMGRNPNFEVVFSTHLSCNTYYVRETFVACHRKGFPQEGNSSAKPVIYKH